MVVHHLHSQTEIRGYLSGRKQLPYARHVFGTRAEAMTNPGEAIRHATERLGAIAHMQQVHGNRVTYAQTSGLYEECDAIYTDKSNLWLAVKTADCVPILISSPEAVAAVHAGWRGLENEILPRTIEILCKQFRQDPSDLYLTVGPCISQANYEVDGSFTETFDAKFFHNSKNEGKYMLDLTGIALQQAKEAGVLDIHCTSMNRCTYAEADTFVSHRRYTHGSEDERYKNARQVSLIQRAED